MCFYLLFEREPFEMHKHLSFIHRFNYALHVQGKNPHSNKFSFSENIQHFNFIISLIRERFILSGRLSGACSINYFKWKVINVMEFETEYTYVN